jgi:hypothetical protein
MHGLTSSGNYSAGYQTGHKLSVFGILAAFKYISSIVQLKTSCYPRVSSWNVGDMSLTFCQSPPQLPVTPTYH